MYNYLHLRNRQASLNQYSPAGREVILMIRGLSRSYRTWMGLHEDLSEAFDVICVDLPGVGLSKDEKPLYSVKKMAQAYLKIIETLGLSRVFFVAPSLGALVVCEMVLHLPREKVGGLILMSPSHSGLGLNRLSLGAIRNFSQAFSSSIEDRCQMAKALLVGKRADGRHPFEVEPALESEWVQNMILDSQELGSKGQLAQIIAALSHTSRSALNHIRHYQIPVKVLLPTDDKLIPFKHAQAFYLYLRHPQSAVIEMQNAGHDLLASHKAQLRDIITQFIRQQDSQRVYPIQPIPHPLSARRPLSLGLITLGLLLLSWAFLRSGHKT